ncbi:MAG: hypothetical protein JW913_08275 [Chitinispirillaceae bacterium]|nr:hypothetical protein [Chitinispirillaceae bacterium]
MTQVKKTAGICTTCNNIEACERLPGHTRHVFFCEEFDDASALTHNVLATVTSIPEKHIDIALGLCCDCGNRTTCANSKTPGGIWHCEEYA